MNKFIYLILGLIGLSFPAFAETTSDGRTIVNCPKEVQCMVNGKIETCYASDDPYKIWEGGYTRNYGRIVKGVYKYKKSYSRWYEWGYVEAYKNSAKANSSATDFGDECLYSYTDDLGVERLIGLNSNVTRLSPFLDTTSLWSIIGSDTDAYDGNCLSNNPQLCPLAEIQGISYKSEKEKYGSFKYYYNETNPNSYSSQLDYKQLLLTCGATSVCKIDVAIRKDMSTYLFTNVGTLTIDISKPNLVKIVGVDTDTSSDCTLKKKEHFNIIYCEPKRKN